MPAVRYKGRRIPYEVRLSRRATRMSLVVHADGRCELVLPEGKRVPDRVIRRFLYGHRDWLLKAHAAQERYADKVPLTHQGIPTDLVRKRTLLLVRGHIDLYCAQESRFRPSGLKVRSYKTRWGSCSRENRLCFHEKLCLLPPALAEYVVVHELCHTVHFNHSRDFWKLVEAHCPDMKARKKELKRYLV